MISWQKEFYELLKSKNGYEFKKFNKNRPMILYGAGSLGKMAITLLNEQQIIPTCVIDRNLKGKINSIPIKKIDDLTLNEIESSLFIICISSIEFLPIYNDLKNIGCKYIIQFYDYSEVFFKSILGNGWSKSGLTNEDKIFIQRVFKSLEHDKNSISHYLQFLWWKIKRIERIYKEFPVLSDKKYFKSKCFPSLRTDERYLDCGAHLGGTIIDFIKVSKEEYSKIWAFEPDKYNMSCLKEKTSKYKNMEYFEEALSNINNQSVSFYNNLGFASKIDKDGGEKISTRTIDSYTINPSIIKLHIEGSELKALEGAKNTINSSRPVLMVLADHNEDGLYKIANFLIELENYKLYFYLHDYCGNSAIFYAIPEEREKIF